MCIRDRLYIGGYGKIIAGKSLAFAFMNGFKIDKITGLEMLDTSNVTDMSYMFYSCGRYSQVFTLDLGNNFDTSNVTNMSYMFYSCGNESAVFTLDLGEKFDTSNVTDMHYMFSSCGVCSQVFTLEMCIRDRPETFLLSIVQAAGIMSLSQQTVVSVLRQERGAIKNIRQRGAFLYLSLIHI